ncbi:MAG: hypothetical protein PUP91_27445 [Rhizonema sp. PD37]|nr:hypothetical protein [Rhizonema sp. PD37]
MVDLSGTWLGTYWQGESATRFEAILIQSGNSLTGRIQDDSSLGEAQLSGEVIGRRLSFIKRYLMIRNTSVDYVGTVSEDEDFIQGQWTIKGYDVGPWEARRSGESLTLNLEIQRSKVASPLGGVVQGIVSFPTATLLVTQ